MLFATLCQDWWKKYFIFDNLERSNWISEPTHLSTYIFLTLYQLRKYQKQYWKLLTIRNKSNDRIKINYNVFCSNKSRITTIYLQVHFSYDSPMIPIGKPNYVWLFLYPLSIPNVKSIKLYLQIWRNLVYHWKLFVNNSCLLI